MTVERRYKLLHAITGIGDIDLTMSPTWSGNHTWLGATAGANTLTISAPGANGTSASINRAALFLGRANSYTAELAGSLTSGQSYGLLISAGTTSVDNSLMVQSQAGAAYFQVRGDGAIGFHGATPQAVNAGWGTPTGGSAVSSFPGATATLLQCSTAIAQLITYFKAMGLLAT